MADTLRTPTQPALMLFDHALEAGAFGARQDRLNRVEIASPLGEGWSFRG